MPHRKSPRLYVESVERRILLSGYALSPAGYFGGNASGVNPQSTLVADSSGNLYGTARAGGVYGLGTVLEVAKGSNAITVLASFNGTDGATPSAGLAIDPSGNLFGATRQSGANNYGTVFEIARGTMAITTLASFHGTDGRAPNAVTLDASGNLYGTTAYGGSNAYGAVFEIANGSDTITTLASFTRGNGATPLGAVTLDAANDLFGTTSYGGMDSDGTVFEIASGSNAITTLASLNQTDGMVPQAGVMLDGQGDVFGTASEGGANSNGTVFEVASGSSAITALASFNGTNGAGPQCGLAMDAAGALYGTTASGGAYGQGTAFEIAAGSNAITTIASFNGSNGQQPEAGVLLDSSGNLYGTTYQGGANNQGAVYQIAGGSNVATTLASLDQRGTNPAQTGVTLDAEGNLFGTTAFGGAFGDGTVFEIASGSNTPTTLASFNGTDGQSPSIGVTVDKSGNLFGTTSSGGANNDGTVFELAGGSNTITTLGSFSVTVGSTPNPLTLDASGNLYGTASAGGAYNSGTVFEVANGSQSITDLADFTQSNGADPEGAVVIDGSGNLYGAAFYGGLNTDGGVVFELASGSHAISVYATFPGGTATTADYPDGEHPRSITLDAAGDVFGTTAGNLSGGPAGDAYPYGTVFEIASGSSAVTTLAVFNKNNGADPNVGLAIDAAGNLFGTTFHGGTNDTGTFFELASGSNVITTVVSFNGPNGLEPVVGPVLDGRGNLYGTTQQGGAAGTGTIFELVANTTFTVRPADGSNPSTQSQSLTFTASVSGGVPDGEAVTLVDTSNNNATVATGTLNGGSATLTVPAGTLSVGTHNLIAAYAGDANFAASESAAYAQVVQAAAPTLLGAPVINGDNPNDLVNAPGQPTPGVQRSNVEDIVYTFNEPVMINDANAAFTLALAGQMTGTLPATLYAAAVPGSNGTQWAVSLTGQAVGTFGSIANGEYSITINPNAVFAAADGTTQLATGETDTFYRLFGDLGGNRAVNAQDIGKMKMALATYNPALDANWDGTDSALDVGRLKPSLAISYANDGFVTSI